MSTDNSQPAIQLLVLDIDGVLTTGQLPYLDAGGELKLFHVQDGSAIKLWHKTGGQSAIITGRNTPAVVKRAKDLGIPHVIQGVPEKLTPYAKLRDQIGLSDAEIAVVGDDWLDLEPMRRCGFPFAVANAIPTVKRAARYITHRPGGHGAIVEVVQRILRLNGKWNGVLSQYLKST